MLNIQYLRIFHDVSPFKVFVHLTGYTMRCLHRFILERLGSFNIAWTFEWKEQRDFWQKYKVLKNDA